MAKAIKQFRYFGDNAVKNQPKGAISNDFVSGNIFSGGTSLDSKSYYPIIQLGIQALPGTKFYLNDSIEPIIIGARGLFELDLDGVAEITQLSFDPSSINLIKTIDNAYVIIDIVYDDGAGEDI